MLEVRKTINNIFFIIEPIYNKKGKSINKQRILLSDDVIILFKGGHGFDVLEDCKIIEIKQGPYNKKSDKIVFNDKKTNSSKYKA